MNATSALSLVRKAIQYLCSEGHAFVSIADLDSYLNDLQERLQADEEGISEAHIEMLRADNQATLANWEQQRLDSREEYKAVIQAGRYAMNAAMSINGAASAALLAVLSHHVARELVIPEAFRYALLLYLGGIFLGAVAYGITYLTTFSYRHGHQKRGDILNVTATLAVGLSLACFCAGGWLVFVGFA